MRPISEQSMAQYRETALARELETQQAVAARRERAWIAARRAADLLRAEFGASRVVLFGSLARGDLTLHSDIDLAAWGIPRDDYFVAVARVQDVSAEFKVDLVEADHCKPTLARAIADERIPL